MSTRSSGWNYTPRWLDRHPAGLSTATALRDFIVTLIAPPFRFLRTPDDVAQHDAGHARRPLPSAQPSSPHAPPRSTDPVAPTSTDHPRPERVTRPIGGGPPRDEFAPSSSRRGQPCRSCRWTVVSRKFPRWRRIRRWSTQNRRPPDALRRQLLFARRPRRARVPARVGPPSTRRPRRDDCAKGPLPTDARSAPTDRDATPHRSAANHEGRHAPTRSAPPRSAIPKPARPARYSGYETGPSSPPSASAIATSLHRSRTRFQSCHLCSRLRYAVSC